MNVARKDLTPVVLQILNRGHIEAKKNVSSF